MVKGRETTVEMTDAPPAKRRNVKWDEENLRRHEVSVARGEYGTMSIDEPKTPFAVPASPAASEDVDGSGYGSDMDGHVGEDDSELMSVDQGVVALPGHTLIEGDDEGVAVGCSDDAPVTSKRGVEGAGPSTSFAEDLHDRLASSESEDKKQRLFEAKRKSHYNMREALRRSRDLMADEDDSDEGEGENGSEGGLGGA